jgi:hypothetical protein
VTEIQAVEIERLYPHPDNPRLQLREDVVERLAAEIARTGFGPEHAPLVRSHGDGFQIISGHHRIESAERAGLSAVPCWVREMDDDEAFMQLVLSNTQGELSPLEIGMHALKAVPPAERKAGQGFKAYAERIGITGAYVGQLHAAAQVITTAKLEFSSAVNLADKAKHLYEISKAPKSVWTILVERLLSRGWSVADTGREIEKIRKFEIPDEHAYWLPFDAVAEAYVRADRLNPAAVAKLISAAEGVFAYIERDGTDEDREAFRAWLAENSGGNAWNARKISDYHADLIRDIADRREQEAELPEGVDLRLGDFREVLKDLDGTVDAIITDPPYPEEFLPLFDGLGEAAGRLLKPGGICAAMVGQSYLPQIIDALGKHLTYHWTLAYLTPGGQAVQLWQRKVNTFWKPVLIYVKGEYAGDWLGDVTKSDINDNDKQHHHWGQSESGMADLIGRLTKPDQLIVDPFLGGGTTAVVAHDMARRFVGCDIDETCLSATKARFGREESTA